MKRKFFLFGLILMTIYSCREEFDDHYKAEGESTISENIIDILRADPDFSLFIAAIDRLDLAKTLGQSAIYTCLAPTNTNVEEYLKAKGYSSIEDVPKNDLNKWLNYHWIYGMYYRYDLEKTTSDMESLVEFPSFYQSNSDIKTREDSKNPGKQIRFYTSSWLSGRASDFRFLKNVDIDPTSFSVEGVLFTDRYDINAANGVIHVLSGPLMPLPRADEAIAQDTTLSIIHHWLEDYVAYEIKGLDDFGKIDTTKIKSYTFGADIADEDEKYTFIAPTNEAIRKFFGPYLADNFYNEYDSIPTKLIESILLTSFVHDYWGMSDITRGDAAPFYVLGLNFSYFRISNDVEPHYAGGVSASNTMIYKVNEMVKPAILTSVEGGIYMNQSKYKEWGKMLNKGEVSGLTSILLYTHPVRTMLVQPDQVWTKFVEDFSTEKQPDASGYSELDSLGWSLNVGVIFDNIQDGEFKERTYYNTGHGSIFYENETFTDYLGNSVNLISKESTWEGTNGAIYEIDGFLSPLVATDTNATIYKKLEASADHSLFRFACELTGVSEALKQIGYFQYTVLAPTNQAFIDEGIDDLSLPINELRKIIMRHIIQRKIFTDGAYSGTIVNLLGEIFSINGKWGDFAVTDAAGVVNYVELENSNQQANNGVIHSVNNFLNEKE